VFFFKKKILCFNYNFLFVLFFHFNPHSFNFLLCFSSFLVSVILNPSLFLVRVSESIVFVSIFYFDSFLFCASFIFYYYFDSILICVYYVFQFSYSTFDFFFFSFALFFKILIVLNFTLQIQKNISIVIIYFSNLLI